MLNYYEMVYLEGNSEISFGPGPFIFYSFFVLLILKILLLLKASTVSSYLLPVVEESKLHLRIDDICIIIGILTCVIEIPTLIISILKYKKAFKDLDDPYAGFTEKADVYLGIIRILIASVLIFRKDLIARLSTNKERS